LLPVYNTRPEWLEQAIDSILNQTYDNWQLCIVDDASTTEGVRAIISRAAQKDSRIKALFLEQNKGVAFALNRAAEETDGEYLICLDHDDFLSPDALYEVVSVLNKDRNLEFLYSDEAVTNPQGVISIIYFRPEFSEAFFLSHPYIVHLVAIRRSLFLKAGCFEESMTISHDYDLFLRALAAIDAPRIGHIPKVLYYWRQHPGSLGRSLQSQVTNHSKRAISKYLKLRNIDATVEDGPVSNTFRVRYPIKEPQLLTIVIPTKDKVELLQKCIASIEKQDAYRSYELLIVDNNSSTFEALAYLDCLRKRYKILKYDGEFNFSRINNIAGEAASGELLLFMNNDVELIAPDSLLSMVELFERPSTGIVGAKLLYPDNRIQHAGVVLGLIGVCEHLFKFQNAFLPDGLPERGYLNSLVSIRNYSAVTAACMMIRRSLFTKVKGFDENIKVGFGDIDLCLRVRELGYDILFTPYALLRHHESATRRSMKNPRLMEHKEDVKYFTDRWNRQILTNDPFFNQNLSLWTFNCLPALENE